MACRSGTRGSASAAWTLHIPVAYTNKCIESNSVGSTKRSPRRKFQEARLNGMAGPSELNSARLRRDLSLALRRRLTIAAGVGAAGLTIVFSLIAATTAPGKTTPAATAPSQPDPSSSNQQQFPGDDQPAFNQPSFQQPSQVPQN